MFENYVQKMNGASWLFFSGDQGQQKWKCAVSRMATCVYK